ncbi:SipW-dependent-type signal peptide-containing protein [Nesterenkonia sp. AY15]|uniref:SipW-dependent-type signal peptide-containing protein n=1 Tax=unclassified Nesterenkonia TaxID=2629769 RepID=UPI001F4D1FD0|nr:SipW-dependent-type signal peptide-containing protein [Nesterenkonia sp. AY15]MCH8569791.1 SipW-dependent-type signal peptide-containing protein [Nesterenkonia sp. AY15]
MKMSAAGPTHDRVCSPRGRRLAKLRALLASGSVLGLGAFATVASWTDQQDATGTLTAGEFVLTSSTNGEDFSQYSPDAPAPLFIDAAEVDMIPGSPVYALLSVSTDEGSVGGAVALLAHPDNITGLGAHLTYGVQRLPPSPAGPPSCNADSFTASETAVVPLGSSLADGGGPGSEQALQAQGSDQVDFCFAITLPPEISPSPDATSVEASWELAGTANGTGSNQ